MRGTSLWWMLRAWLIPCLNHRTFSPFRKGRFPRPCLLSLLRGGSKTVHRQRVLARQSGVTQKFSHDASHADDEARLVVFLAEIEPERLFVKVAEQVERLHAHV